MSLITQTDGKIAWTPGSGENFSVNTIGDAWSEIDGIYHVPAGNGLQQLLEYLVNTATIGGTILLGEGTHTLSWTSAFAINQSVNIIGVSPVSTILNFTQDDADNYFDIDTTCKISNVKITATGWSSSAPNYVIDFGSSAEDSVIENCEFDTIPAVLGIFNIPTGAPDVLIRDNLFSSTPVGAGTAVIDTVGLGRLRFIDNYLPDCDCEYLIHVPDSSTTLDLILRGNNLVAAAAATATGKIYFGDQCVRGIIEGNFLDYTASVAATFISLGGTGSGAGDYGHARFVNNSVRCDRASATSWSSGVNLMEVNAPRTVVANNIFRIRHVGYTNTQQGAVLSLQRYADDAVIEGNNFYAWDCRTGIEIYSAVANVPARPKIIGNSITELDHDGTGNGYGIYFNMNSVQGPDGFIITNNIITADSSSEHTSIGTSDGTSTYYPSHGVIMGNVQEGVSTIPASKFLYCTIIGNVNVDVDSTAGTSVSGTNTSNVYGDDDSTGNPSTAAPGANQ